MKKGSINKAVSTPDLQGSNVKASAIKDKALQASVSACDTTMVQMIKSTGERWRETIRQHMILFECKI